MWDTNPRKILVAVEHRGDQAALQYAAEDAVRRGCGVHLVHVARPAVTAACALDDVVMVEDELQRCGHAVLTDTATRVERLLHVLAPDDDRLSVSTELAHGRVVATLRSLSKHAAVLVLQHEGMGHRGETATLSVTAAVSTRAECPVVAVPDEWRAAPEPLGVVVVGVDLRHSSRLLIEAALREAARRGARLRLVHAYELGSRPEVGEVLKAEIATGLDALVAECRAAGPAVPVEIVAAPGPAGQVLRDAAEGCDLVVVGRHHRTHIVGAPLGRTGRELLRWASVPVLVVDPLRGDVDSAPMSPGEDQGRPPWSPVLDRGTA